MLVILEKRPAHARIVVDEIIDMSFEDIDHVEVHKEISGDTHVVVYNVTVKIQARVMKEVLDGKQMEGV